MKEYIKKLYNIYRNLSLPIKASIWFTICNCIQKATQIITTPIYTRILSTNQYGEYTVFLSWVEFVAIFTTLDIFYSGYNVGMEKFKNDRENYTSSMYGICMAMTTIWLLICIIFSDFFTKIMGISTIHLIILILYMYIYPIYQFWSAQKKYTYKYKLLIVITCCSSILTIILGTTLAKFVDEKSTGVIVAKVIAETIIAIPLWITSIKNIKKLYNKFYWKYALKFNIPLIPHYVSTMILNHSDRIMILNMCNSSYAGIYSVAYSIAMLITIVQNAINSAFVPWFYKKLNSHSFNKINHITTYIVIGEAILNLLLIIMAPEAIKILSTTEYMEAIWIIPPVSFGIFLTGIYGLFVNVELFYGNNKITAISSMIAAIVNLILNYVFIKIYGYIAAGYTTFISYLLLTIIHYFGVIKVCKKNKIEFALLFNIKNILFILVGFIISSIIIMLCYNNILARYFVFCVIGLLIFLFRKKIINFIKEIRTKQIN